MKLVALLCVAIMPLLAPTNACSVSSITAEDVANLPGNATSTLEEKMAGYFPAKLYMRAARNDDQYYSCVELTLYSEPQAPAAERFIFGGGGGNDNEEAEEEAAEESVETIRVCRWWFLWWCWGGWYDVEVEPEKEYEYNARLTYYDSGSDDTEDDEMVTLNFNYTIAKTAPYNIVLDGKIPSGMFLERDGKSVLTISDVGDDYFVIGACTEWTSWFTTYYDSHYYMFAAPSMNLTDMDSHCMAEGFAAMVGHGSARPAGICT